MRVALTIALLSVLAPGAQAASHTLVVDDVTRWRTPEKFSAHEAVRIRVFIRGKEADDTPESGSDRAAWVRGGVLVEVRTARRRGPLRFDIANARRRDARVRIVYRRVSRRRA